MIRRVVLLGILFIASSFNLPVSDAQDDDTGMCQGIVLVEGWVRPSVSATTAIYGKFINLGAEDDMLVGITSDIAPTIELHQSSMVDDVMEMRPVEEGIPLPAQGVTSLEQGGLHGMVIGLTDFVEIGQTITVEFEFKHAGSFEVELVAGDPAEFEYEVPPQAIVMNGQDCEDIVGFYGTWGRPALAEGTSAVYGVLLNLSAEDDTLVSATTDRAGMVELHESTMTDDGMMMMHPVKGGISIPAGGYAILQPGGLHIMLLDLADAIQPEMDFTITLVFENAGELVSPVSVHAEEKMADMNMKHKQAQ